ncbi:hypothetical protein ACQ86G_27215 [Roseateles chitinivorans]|uniref:hypothetical protein n=1 Tax=Roseateles chitinivorans TaxID=2917965 RepID=UPI003D66BF1B
MNRHKHGGASHAPPHPASGALPDGLLHFSFRLLHATDKFDHDKVADAESYLSRLLSRLQGLSSMRPDEFRRNRNRALRIHPVDWSETTEQRGFSHLPSGMQNYGAWQFQLTANEHGRVHGILVEDVFYIVWLDPEHRLYQ